VGKPLDYRVVVVSKAEPNHADHKVPGACIDITEPMPAFDAATYVADGAAFHQRQAELIHRALTGSLPGGTLSNLFALMAMDRVSIFRVLDPAADVALAAAITVDLETQRAAALAIHRPCHTADTEPYGCQHGHQGFDENTGAISGVPDQPAECMACTYDDRTYAYPCPTAQALGVTA